MRLSVFVYVAIRGAAKQKQAQDKSEEKEIFHFETSLKVNETAKLG
jgi:hypothetical protein